MPDSLETDSTNWREFHRSADDVPATENTWIDTCKAASHVGMAIPATDTWTHEMKGRYTLCRDCSMRLGEILYMLGWHYQQPTIDQKDTTNG